MQVKRVNLTLRDGSVTPLKVTVVPSIAATINRIPLKVEDIAFLNKEFSMDKLADSLPCQLESSTIEMLIGNDYYFELLQPRKIDLGEGLFLFYFKLGWILSGQVHITQKRPVNQLYWLVPLDQFLWESR